MEPSGNAVSPSQWTGLVALAALLWLLRAHTEILSAESAEWLVMALQKWGDHVAFTVSPTPISEPASGHQCARHCCVALSCDKVADLVGTDEALICHGPPPGCCRCRCWHSALSSCSGPWCAGVGVGGGIPLDTA